MGCEDLKKVYMCNYDTSTHYRTSNYTLTLMICQVKVSVLR